jgi:hypothetical protein
MSDNMVSVHHDQTRGNHVLALADIAEGVTVIKSRAIRTQSSRDKYSIQIGNQHVIIDSPGIYVNHSCKPNCTVQPNLQGGMDFISVRKIAAGEEIFWDYHSHEDEIATPFVCSCHTDRCRGLIFKYQNPITLSEKTWNLTLTVENFGRTLVIHINGIETVLRFELTHKSVEADSHMGHPDTTLCVLPHESTQLIGLAVQPPSLSFVFEDGSQSVVALGTLLGRYIS